MDLEPGKTYMPIGRCIYCGVKNGDLGKEHIIPLGLGGNLLLPKASCRNCEKITGPMERVIMRSMLGNLRIRLGLPTRRPGQRPAAVQIHLMKSSGGMVRANVAAKDIPLMYAGLKLPPPRVLQALPPTDKHDWQVVGVFSAEAQAKHLKDGGGIFVNQIDWIAFLRFLAKIGHAFAVGQLGIDGFRPLLQNIILNKPHVLLNSLPQLIGGGQDLPDAGYVDPGMSVLHRLQIHAHDATGFHFVLVSIRLFSFLGAPTYFVVVGEK